MFENPFRRKESDTPEYSPHALEDDFGTEDAQAVRRMEDHYIELGHMTEKDRMGIPPEIEFPDSNS